MSRKKTEWQKLHTAEHLMSDTLQSFAQSAVARDLQLILKSDRNPLSRRKLNKKTRAELRQLGKETQKIYLSPYRNQTVEQIVREIQGGKKS